MSFESSLSIGTVTMNNRPGRRPKYPDLYNIIALLQPGACSSWQIPDGADTKDIQRAVKEYCRKHQADKRFRTVSYRDTLYVIRVFHVQRASPFSLAQAELSL